VLILRILHTPNYACNQPWTISRAQRKLGLKSDFMVYDSSKNGWVSYPPDYDLHLFKCSKPLQVLKLGTFFLKCIPKYDIFHFHTFPFFGKYYYDLPILKAAGKKIFFHHWGCKDGILKSTFSKLKPGICQVCPAGKKGLCSDKDTTKRGKLEHKYADAIFTTQPYFEDFDSDAIFVPNAIDLEIYDPKEKIPEQFLLEPTDAIRIYHVHGNRPTRGDVKATLLVEKAIRSLQKKGHNIEFMYFDKVPIQQVKYYQMQADIVLDQFRFGWYGSNGVLKTLIDDEDYRKELGKKSRRFAVKVHDSIKVAKKITKVYKSVL